MSIPDVTAAARAADRAARALRQAVTRAVADGEKKTEVAAAAGVTRQTVDRWIAQETHDYERSDPQAALDLEAARRTLLPIDPDRSQPDRVSALSIKSAHRHAWRHPMGMETWSWTEARARVASWSRDRPADDPDLLDARRRLKQLRLAEHVQKAVAEAPALTEEQCREIAALLRGGGAA